jgi:glycosyltransferase involved in cell wall biosynthesis
MKKIMIYDAGRHKVMTTGYGLMSLQFGERLKPLGYEINYYDENPNFQADMWLWIRPPHYVEYKQFVNTNINVFFTMCEQAKFEGWKANWPTLLNRCNAVITPTEWNKEVFVNAGVTKPIYVVPLGVDTKKYIGNKTREFSLLSVHEALGKDASRENWKENLEAYYAIFYGTHHTEVSYTFKSWNMSREGFYEYEKKLIDNNGYDRALLPRVDILDMELVPQDMNQLYGKSWVFIKNSQKEGWCLPALEAMAAGTRVIAFPIPSMPYLNSGNADFFQDRVQLKAHIWANFRQWRKWRVEVDQWSWKNATDKLDKTLKEIMHV